MTGMLDPIDASWVITTGAELLERTGSPDFDIVLVGAHDARAVLLAYEIARLRLAKVGFYSLEDGLLSVSHLVAGHRVVAILDGELPADALERMVSRYGARLVASTSVGAATT